MTASSYEPMTVLIADDHHKHRRLIRLAVESCEDYKVLSVVNNGKEAVRYLSIRRPDIVLLDDDMPVMNGLETLRAIREDNAANRDLPPVKVVMLQSGFKAGASMALRAIEKGAHAFIPKPTFGNDESYIATFAEAFKRKAPRPRVRKKTQITYHPRAAPHKAEPVAEENPTPKRSTQTQWRVILIGSSTGGPPVLRFLLPQIRQVSDLPVVLVQHISEPFTQSVADNIQRYSGYKVVVPSRLSFIEPGHLYLAPGGKHLVLDRDQQRRLQLRLNNDPPVHSCKPSVDVMLQSATKYLGHDALVMILTGMGGDGAEGAKAMRNRGATVLAQDRESSVVWGMPGAAVQLDAVDHILSPSGMVKYIRDATRIKTT
jgi:two-component system chemotaxis response regulator CheB